MITHKWLDDFSSVYQSYLGKFESNDKNGSNTDGYKYYRFVSSPDAVVLFDFGRVNTSDINSNQLVKKIWNPLAGTNTPDAWKIKLGSKYSEIKRSDYADIEAARTKNTNKNITSVKPGLLYKIVPLINNRPMQPDPFDKSKSLTPVPSITPNASGKNYVKNMQNDLGINSESVFLTSVLDQGWLDSFRSNSPSLKPTVDFSSYSKLFQSAPDATIENNAIGVEWFGYFKPPDLSVQYSFKFSTSNGGNFLMWLGNKAICEYTPSNADLIFPNVEFTPNPPIREPKYYPIRIQYYANANKPETPKDTILPRNFSFGIKNLTTKNDLDLQTVLFTINDGKYFPKLQYLSFLSTSIDLFANAALTCYTNDIDSVENMNTFYNFINSQKYITLKKTNDKDTPAGNDQFAIIKADGTFYSQVSIPNNPLSLPVVFSIYRLDVDMRMNKTFQINTEKDPATNSYTMNPIDENSIKPGFTYTTLPNYYPDNPSAGINATATECKKLCTGSKPGESNCNWYFSYESSNGQPRCLVDTKNTQPVFNQIRPTGGNTANSSVNDKSSSLNLRDYSFPKSKGCGSGLVLFDESEVVLNTQIYTDSFPYSTYVIDPKVIKKEEGNLGKCSDPTYLKLNAEARNILAVNALYQEDGKYQHSDGTMSLSNYPSYNDKKFWTNIKEPFSTTNTNALDDTQNNSLKNKAKEQQLENTNSQINSTYSDLNTNIQNYSKMRTFMENDVNYDLSGNTLLYFRNPRKPTVREQNALDSNEGGVTQNSLYILGTITAASLLILAILLGRD
jgi:hypothetical protein